MSSPGIRVLLLAFFLLMTGFLPELLFVSWKIDDAAIAANIWARPRSTPYQAYLPALSTEPKHFLPFITGPVANLPGSAWPPDHSSNQSPNTFLLWQTLNTDGTPLHYEVYLGAGDATPDERITPDGWVNNYFDPSTFMTDTQYYWQVVAVQEEGGRTPGPIWRFRTERPENPPAVETMIAIPAGEFRMGCASSRRPPGGCETKDTPLHTVYLDAYAIDKYEVTNQQYRTCVEADVCASPLRTYSLTRDTYFSDPDYNDYPVLFVSWQDAQTYCGWREKRLPTEAEWEKAARGPVDTRTWPWGEEFPDCTRLNYTDDRDHPDWTICAGDTVRVGSYPAGASPYGVMDMAGNAFEWVADVFDQAYDQHYYAVSPYANPTGPAFDEDVEEDPYFVIRGGSYRPRWYYARVFHRHHGHRGDDGGLYKDRPFYRNDQVGFRCARSVLNR